MVSVLKLGLVEVGTHERDAVLRSRSEKYLTFVDAGDDAKPWR